MVPAHLVFINTAVAVFRDKQPNNRPEMAMCQNKPAVTAGPVTRRQSLALFIAGKTHLPAFRTPQQTWASSPSIK